MQVGLRHRHTVNLGPEHNALHVSSVYSNFASPPTGTCRRGQSNYLFS
jgi:hypothetical protein